MKKLLGLAVLGILSIGTANAGMAVNVLGGLNYNKNSISPEDTTQTISSKGGLTYGATFEFSMVPMFSIELGALSVARVNKYDLGATGVATTTSRGLEIPLMFRFTALPILDFGIGGYYAKTPKKYKVSDSTIVGFPDGEYDIDPTEVESSDYGVRASVRGKFPVAPMIKILVDVNYSMGMKDIDKDPAVTEKNREFALLAGASFGF